MTKREVVIIGAGLAGLSCAYHLRGNQKCRARVLEKGDVVGGTARSYTIDGFTFDITGHLLHLHHPYTKELIPQLLGDNIFSCLRKTAIFSKEVYTDYPFQVNTYGLPKKVVAECVEGFRIATQQYSADAMRATSLPFQSWSLRTFGRGIHKHFMKPYNEKLWQIDLTKMTAEWCGMFVPQPKIEDVVRGSKQKLKKSFGYNSRFFYPRRGGIQVLSEALAQNIDVELNTSFEKIDLTKKKLLLQNGAWQSFDALVSTLPLHALLERAIDLPAAIQKRKQELSWTSVLCINMGVNRAKISDKSWIYFPEKKFPFYRVGFPMNFTPHVAPKGCSSMYVEVGYPPNQPIDWKNPNFAKKIRRGLEAAKILNPKDRILVQQFIPIRYAYVHYTPERSAALQEIFAFLNQSQVYSIGRYGGWKYSFMEEAILDGKSTAETILENL